ncbi:MAG: RNA polymerase sigma factor [Myxococcota bacterium]
MSRFRPHRVTTLREDDSETGSVDDRSASSRLRIVEGGGAEPMPSFEQVYRLHARYVATIALRLLGRPDDVDDIVHDTFLQVRRSLPRLQDPRALKGWLGTITVRVTRRALKRARFRRMIGMSAVPADDATSSRLSAEDYDFVHSAYSSLQRLPTDDRIAWVLRRVHGAQLDVVAAMCGCSLATAKRRISAAERALGEVSK